MLKALIAFLKRLIPSPNFEYPRMEVREELEMRKLKARMMIEGRML